MARESLITQEGLEKLRTELTDLTTVKRREVAARIKEAREFGDIMENSEYDDAKNEQALLEQAHRAARGACPPGDRRRREAARHRHGRRRGPVHVKDQKSGDSKKFQIVGSAEADPAESKLSNESPIGKALVGHKRGDVVTVEVPRGPKRKLKITKIEAA